MANRVYGRRWQIMINLATHPRRNLRLFRLLMAGLVVLVVGLFLFLVIFNLKSFSEYQKISRSNQELVARIDELNAESRKLNREVQNFAQQFKPVVDEINDLLHQKAFSWVKFFSALEEILPPGSYLISLNPARSSSALEFRLKIGLNQRDDLNLLLKNLQKQNFKEIKVLSETFVNNQIQVEISFKNAENQ